MAITTGSTEDIIERRESNPLVTASVILGTLALLGAIVIQLWEIGEQKRNVGGDAALIEKGSYLAEVEKRLSQEEQKVAGLVKDASVLESDRDLWKQRLGEDEVRRILKDVESEGKGDSGDTDADADDADGADTDADTDSADADADSVDTDADADSVDTDADAETETDDEAN
jgi:hypothetical protein